MVKIAQYFPGDFDAMVISLRAAAGNVTAHGTISENGGPFRDYVVIGSMSGPLYATPQFMAIGSGFTYAPSGAITGGVATDLRIGAAGAAAPGSIPMINVTGFSGSVLNLLNDTLAAIRSTAIEYSGSSGADVFTGGAFGDVLAGGAGADTLMGGIGLDTLRGGADADKLFGGKGSDSLIGGAGNDILTGGNGPDQLDGGADIDRASYESADAAIVVDLAAPNLNTGHAAGDTYFNIEGIEGGNFNDHLSGDTGDNVLIGGLGSDTLYGRAGHDTLMGDIDNVFSSQFGGNDTLFGGQGDDVLWSLYGNDTMTGGSGADYFIIYGSDPEIGRSPRGHDVITDFSIADDHLILRGFVPSESYFYGAMEQVGNDVVIHSEQSDATVTIANVTRAAMLQADVDFF